MIRRRLKFDFKGEAGMEYQFFRDFKAHHGTLVGWHFQYLSICILGLLILAFFSSGCSNEKPRKPASAPIPITVGMVTQKAVPIQLRAIGNVQAYSTVTVKSRVAGQIMQVHFKEGEDVRKGISCL